MKALDRLRPFRRLALVISTALALAVPNTRADSFLLPIIVSATTSGDNITIMGTDATGNFSASVTSQGITTNYSGTYSTTPPDGITVHLTSPLPTDLVGTYRLRNDSLAVSGTVAGQRLSLVGTRVP